MFVNCTKALLQRCPLIVAKTFIVCLCAPLLNWGILLCLYQQSHHEVLLIMLTYSLIAVLA